jgi:hypothetical protein
VLIIFITIVFSLNHKLKNEKNHHAEIIYNWLQHTATIQKGGLLKLIMGKRHCIARVCNTSFNKHLAVSLLDIQQTLNTVIYNILWEKTIWTLSTLHAPNTVFKNIYHVFDSFVSIKII